MWISVLLTRTGTYIFRMQLAHSDQLSHLLVFEFLIFLIHNETLEMRVYFLQHLQFSTEICPCSYRMHNKHCITYCLKRNVDIKLTQLSLYSWLTLLQMCLSMCYKWRGGKCITHSLSSKYCILVVFYQAPRSRICKLKIIDVGILLAVIYTNEFESG